MRLIDADRLMQDVRQDKAKCYLGGIYDVQVLVDAQKTMGDGSNMGMCATMTVTGKWTPVKVDDVSSITKKFKTCVKDMTPVDGGCSFVFEGSYSTGVLLQQELFEFARQADARVIVEGD